MCADFAYKFREFQKQEELSNAASYLIVVYMLL